MAPRNTPKDPLEDVEIVETDPDFVLPDDDLDEDLPESEPHVDPTLLASLPGEPIPDAAPVQATTTTRSFMNDRPMTVDSIEDLGVELVDPAATSFVVRVWCDVGPIFYGSEEVHLLKNHRYRVKPHIYEYLTDRGLLWEQQVAPDGVSA